MGFRIYGLGVWGMGGMSKGSPCLASRFPIWSLIRGDVGHLLDSQALVFDAFAFSAFRVLFFFGLWVAVDALILARS